MNHRLIQEIISGIWMIKKDVADAYLPLVSKILTGNTVNVDVDYVKELREKGKSMRIASFINGAFQVDEYKYSQQPEKAPENSIAIIDINDVIFKYDQACGPSGMITKADLIKRCDSNSNITAIILNIDSGGGEGYAARMMNDVIKNTSKPVIAFIDDIAASAAYYLASACDYIVANNKMAQIGSIGTFITVADYTDYWKQEGIRLIEVYADKSSEKNKAYYEALKGNIAPLKEFVNAFNENFLNDIRVNRGEKLKNDEKVWGTGKIFFAEDALKEGLIDNIGSLDMVLESIKNSSI